MCNRAVVGDGGTDKAAAGGRTGRQGSSVDGGALVGGNG